MPTKVRTAYHHGDLKNALIDAALKQIARVGARALSLRETARSAGVSHSAAYRHFANKESLLAAIAEQGFGMLANTLNAAILAHADDPAVALQASGVAYVEFGVGHPEHLQVMFGGLIASPQDYPTLQARSKVAYEQLAGTVSDGLRKRQLRGGDEHMLALASWALVHGLSQLIAGGQLRSAKGPESSPRDVALAVTTLLRQGIGASATNVSRPRSVVSLAPPRRQRRRRK